MVHEQFEILLGVHEAKRVEDLCPRELVASETKTLKG